MRTSAEELGSQDLFNSLTGYDPNDYFLTETYVECNPEPVNDQRFNEDLEYDDSTIGQTLFYAYRRRVDHSEGEDLSHDRIKFLLKRQREQILADCQAEMRKHQFQAHLDRRSLQKLSDTIESQQEELYCAQAEERCLHDHQLLHEQLLKQNWDLREALEKSLKEKEELKKFQIPTFDTVTRRKLIEDQGTILELTGKLQELQNEINCMNESKDFLVAESVRSGHSHVTSQSSSFPTHPVLGGLLSRPTGKPSLQRWAASHLGYARYIGKRFCKSSCVFYSSLSAGIESMDFPLNGAESFINGGEEKGANTSTRSEMPVRTVSQKFIHP